MRPGKNSYSFADDSFKYIFIDLGKGLSVNRYQAWINDDSLPTYASPGLIELIFLNKHIPRIDSLYVQAWSF